MIDYSVIIKNYPNISKVFTQDWFEKEITKNKNEMHLLAKQFTFTGQDGSSLDSSSLQYINFLEKLLKDMEVEINSQKDHFKRLLGTNKKGNYKENKKDYISTLAQIEIGSFFKKMGLNPEFEPSIQGKDGKGDIKINNDGVEVFIEVTIKEGPRTGDICIFSWDDIDNLSVNDKDSLVEIREINFTQPQIYGKKFDEKNRQLLKFSPNNPNIVALYLDTSSIPERENIIRGLGLDIAWEKNGNTVHIKEGEHKIYNKEEEHIIDNSMISAVLLYFRYFDNKHNIVKELCLNPKADNQLPDSLIAKFRDFDTKIIIPVSYKDQIL